MQKTHDNCVNYFSTENKLKQHGVNCNNLNDIKMSFLSEKYINFKNHVNKEKLSFVMYCDFESILLPFQNEQGLKKK